MGLFNRKKKQEISAQVEITNLHVLFKEQMQAVDHIREPDKKLLKLEEMKFALEDKIAKKKAQNNAKAKQKENWVGFGSSLTQGAAWITLVLTVGMPVLALPAALGGMVFGSAYIGRKAKNSAEKRLEEESVRYLETLASQESVISEIESRIVNDNVDEIAGSPLRDKIFENYPHISDLFAVAAAQKIAEKNKPPFFSSDHQPKL
jgi:hypothetical protein